MLGRTLKNTSYELLTRGNQQVQKIEQERTTNTRASYEKRRADDQWLELAGKALTINHIFRNILYAQMIGAGV